jgi:plastocyanin
MAGVVIGLIFGALVLRVVFASADAGVNVAISGFAYSPAQTTVRVGEAVTWTNSNSAAHTVTADDASFNSGTLAQGGVYSRTFDATGIYSYSCAIHPSMVGSVRVISETRVHVPLVRKDGQAGTPPPSGPPAGPPASATNSGKWSDPATWGGALPQAGAAVTIPGGKIIVLDVSPPPLTSVMIEGQLIFDDSKDLALSANWIMVHGSGGKLQIGAEQAPYLKRAVVTLTGNNANEDIMGMGSKLLGAMMGGRIEIYGKDRVSWTQLGVNATKGATQITLKESVTWRAGESIVIASSSMNPNEAEVRTIAAVNGATLTLDKPLDFAHYGALQTFGGKLLDERAEVGLLSRNIVIQGDEASAASKFGGHVMIMGGSSTARETLPAMRGSAKIRGVAFQRMGQFNRRGRYPFHWHLLGDATGDFIRNSVVRDSIQRGIVVHGTDNVLVQDNVIYNSVGHAYIVEDGSERGNTFDRNLGLLPQPVTFTADLLKDQNDIAAATFWLRTAAMTMTRNSSAGGQFAGYWFDMGFVEGNNATKAALTFRDNVVHSHRDGRVPGTENDTWAIWHTDGFVPSDEGVLTFERVTAYKNGAAIQTAGRGVTHDSVLAGNGKAFSNHWLRNSVVVSRSGNSDTSEDWGEIGMFAYGGFANAENVTWVGFKDGHQLAGTLACGIENPRFNTRGNVMIDSVPAAGCGDVINADLDGTLTGTGQPAKIVDNGSPFGLVTAACQMRDGVAICPNYDYRTLGVNYPIGPGFANPNWRVDVVRDEDNARQTPNHFRWVAYTIPGKSYRLELRSATNASDPTVYPLTTLTHVNLELSTGDQSDPVLKPGGRNVVYDPNWASAMVTVTAAAPTAAFRVRGCNNGATCDDDSAQWPQLAPATSLAALQATQGAGYFVDVSAGRIVFKLNGGDRLRFERA